MNTTKQRKQYTADFKSKAVELMAAGRPVSELAKELCISANLLYSWRRTSQGVRIGSEGQRAIGEEAAADDTRALRRELTLLRQENEILKKAAVILGTKPQPNFSR